MRENRAWLAEQLPALEQMNPDQRAEVATEAEQRFGEYANQTWQLRERVRELNAAEQAADPPDDESGAEEGAKT